MQLLEKLHFFFIKRDVAVAREIHNTFLEKSCKFSKRDFFLSVHGMVVGLRKLMGEAEVIN